MNNYKVEWHIDIEAENAVEAAREARRIQLDKDSTATVFKVSDNKLENIFYDVDLYKINTENKLYQYPEQTKNVGRKVNVIFNYDINNSLIGTVIRDDAEDSYTTLFKLEDGRIINALECQYSIIMDEPVKYTELPDTRDMNPKLDFNIGDKCFLSYEKGYFLEIKDRKISREFQDCLGYLVLVDNKLEWFTASYFWSLDKLKELGCKIP